MNSVFDEFFEKAHRLLDEAQLSNLPGRVLYSGLHTLTVGQLYILGFNPGGDPDDPLATTLSADLETLRSGKRDNAYISEDWGSAAGEAPFQKRIRWLATLFDTRIEDVCGSNLIFCKSKTSWDVPYPDYAAKCWPVHELILDVVTPRFVVAIGNGEKRSAFSYLRSKISAPIDNQDDQGVQTISSGHPRFQLKAFRGTYNGRPLVVIGLPHLSYYPLTSPLMANCVENFVAALRQR